MYDNLKHFWKCCLVLLIIVNLVQLKMCSIDGHINNFIML